jgi:GxxExxY protein
MSETIVRDVVGAAYEVANLLGAGFLEKIYERALALECSRRGLRVRKQVAYRVEYKGEFVGEYMADLLVEDKVVVELKCVDRFAPEHLAQCINYLKASGLRTALLVNFQRPKIEWRVVKFGEDGRITRSSRNSEAGLTPVTSR